MNSSQLGRNASGSRRNGCQHEPSIAAPPKWTTKFLKRSAPLSLEIGGLRLEAIAGC